MMWRLAGRRPASRLNAGYEPGDHADEGKRRQRAEHGGVSVYSNSRA
jgi:hypothetical protein